LTFTAIYKVKLRKKYNVLAPPKRRNSLYKYIYGMYTIETSRNFAALQWERGQTNGNGVGMVEGGAHPDTFALKYLVFGLIFLLKDK